MINKMLLKICNMKKAMKNQENLENFKNSGLFSNKTRGMENYKIKQISVENVKIGVQNLKSISPGDNTLIGDNFLRILSPVKIGQSNFNASAKYCTSFKWEDSICLVCSKQSSNSDEETKFICSNTNASSKSLLDNLDLLKNSSLCFSSSSNKNSGATKSNLLNIELSLKTTDERPFVSSEESTTLTSNTTSIFYYYKYLFDNDSFILFDSSLTSSSLNFETILWNRATLSSLDLSNLLTNMDQLTPDIFSNSDFNSLCILILSSSINKDIYSEYLSLSKWRRFDKLKQGDEESLYDNSLINSSVVNTGTNDCFLRCLSFDQIAELFNNANAKYGESFGSDNFLSDVFKNFLYSDLSKNLIDSLICFNLDSNSCLDRFDLEKQMSLYFSNSDFINSGAMNLEFSEENKNDAIEFGFINENSILLSNTNSIFYLYFPLCSEDIEFSNSSFSFLERLESNFLNESSLACLPSSTDQLINSCSFGDFNFSNISCFQASSLALDSIQERTNADQFISENLFICSLTSSGTESVIDTILYVKKHKNVEVFKPFDFEKITLINKFKEQQVYDLVIKRESNFVANIISYNTYLSDYFNFISDICILNKPLIKDNRITIKL